MHTLAQLKSGQLKGTVRLRMSCGLKDFPEEIYTLADSLELLDLSGNKLTALPQGFARLDKLKIAFFSDNEFTQLPEVLAECPHLDMVGFKANKIEVIPESALSPNLRWLILTDNRITYLPKSIGKCTELKKLMLAGNRLSQLPSELDNCQNIELLRIAANQFTTFPDVVLKLSKLAWLGFGGNPYNSSYRSSEFETETLAISWHDLEIKEQLGEGASGIISKALWHGNKQTEVAVKVFKGEVTSDGLPIDEINGCIRAGKHENIVSVIGRIENHPENKPGLVLALIPPNYVNLGNPPSFESCTRDTFADASQFSLLQIANISHGIASAACHLHRNGIMHGDLYAHNILIDEVGKPILGDFGANMQYDRLSGFAATFEKLEVRAFGYLLDDLLKRLNPNDANHALTNDVLQLKHCCLNRNLDERPDFDSVCRSMEVIMNRCSMV